MESNTWCPLLTAAMILSGLAVHVMAGSPTFTTELSIRAKLDAKIVVAMTRRGWAGGFVPSLVRGVRASQGAGRALLTVRPI
jgi:hypothetical protein